MQVSFPNWLVRFMEKPLGKRTLVGSHKLAPRLFHFRWKFTAQLARFPWAIRMKGAIANLEDSEVSQKGILETTAWVKSHSSRVTISCAHLAPAENRRSACNDAATSR